MSDIREYFDSLRGKRIAVIGMGVSNTPLIRMLLRADLDVTVCDRAQRERVEEQAEELESLGARLRLGEAYLEGLDQDVIFRTPGLHPGHPALEAARARGAEVTSEMELFFRLCPCRLIGVTGSDGKTTTTTILAEFLKEAGYNVYVGGNIGKPLLPDVSGMEPEDFAVLELSSFQLMTMEQSPHIAVMTNLSPNHLDYHRSMGEYIAAKENIFLHQGEGDRAIFNYDNQLTRDLAEKAGGGGHLLQPPGAAGGGGLPPGRGHLAHQRPGQPGGAAHPGHPAARGAQHRKLHGGHRRRGRTGAGQVRPGGGRPLPGGGAPHRAGAGAGRSEVLQ